jgi:hypothetical protein
MRFALVLALFGLFAAGLWLGCTCGDTLHGIHDGDTIQTTIVARETRPVPGEVEEYSEGVSCGDLGDLVPGAVLVSGASLPQMSEGCPSDVDLAAESLSTADIHGNSVTLPSGCAGYYQVEFETAADVSFLDNRLNDAGEPQWWLMREFIPNGDAGACPDTGTYSCVDLFIAQNVLLPH